MKTRMQLETGKSQHGFVGTFRSIIREEGYAAILVQEISPHLLPFPQVWTSVQRYYTLLP